MRKELKLMVKLRPCPLCGKPVTLSYSPLANAFEIRHAKPEDNWLCYIVESIKLDAISLVDAAEGWNRRRP